MLTFSKYFHLCQVNCVLTPFEGKMKNGVKKLSTAHQFKCRFEEAQLLGYIKIGYGSSKQTFVDQSHELASTVGKSQTNARMNVFI